MAIRKSPYKLNADGIDEAFILPPRKKDRQPPAIKVRRKHAEEEVQAAAPQPQPQPAEPADKPVDLSKVVVSFRTLRDEDEASYWESLQPPQPNKEVGRREVTFELPQRRRKTGQGRTGNRQERQDTQSEFRPRNTTPPQRERRSMTPRNDTGHYHRPQEQPERSRYNVSDGGLTRARAGMVFPSPKVAPAEPRPAPKMPPSGLAFPSPLQRAAEREAAAQAMAQAQAAQAQATMPQAPEMQAMEAMERAGQAQTQAQWAMASLSGSVHAQADEPLQEPVLGHEPAQAFSSADEETQEDGTFADMVADTARLVAENAAYDSGTEDVKAALARAARARAQSLAGKAEENMEDMEDEEEIESEAGDNQDVAADGNALKPEDNPWGEGMGTVPAGRVHFVRFYTWNTLSSHVCSLRNGDGEFPAPGFVTALQDTRSAQPILNAMREAAMKRGWNINIQMLFVPVVYPVRAGFRLWKQVANPFDHNLVYLYYLLKNNALEMVEDHFKMGIKTSKQMRNLPASLIENKDAFARFFGDPRHANCHGIVMRDAAGIFFGKSFPNPGRLINYCVLRREWIVDIKPVAGAPDVLEKVRKDPAACLERIRKVLVTTTDELNRARAAEERKALKAGIAPMESNYVLEDGLECILSSARGKKG